MTPAYAWLVFFTLAFILALLAWIVSPNGINGTASTGPTGNNDSITGSGTTGPTGSAATGPQGVPGIAANTGATGSAATGSIGPTGSAGTSFTGPTGSAGISFTGSIGPTGSAATGNTGQTGSAGSSFTGSTGPTGVSGQPGNPGEPFQLDMQVNLATGCQPLTGLSPPCSTGTAFIVLIGADQHVGNCLCVEDPNGVIIDITSDSLAGHLLMFDCYGPHPGCWIDLGQFNVIDVTGSTGSAATGPTGASFTGSTGRTGPTGQTGSSFTGPTGASFTGASFTGPTGPTGSTGASFTGATGPAGSAGGSALLVDRASGVFVGPSLLTSDGNGTTNNGAILGEGVALVDGNLATAPVAEDQTLPLSGYATVLPNGGSLTTISTRVAYQILGTENPTAASIVVDILRATDGSLTWNSIATQTVPLPTLTTDTYATDTLTTAVGPVVLSPNDSIVIQSRYFATTVSATTSYNGSVASSAIIV